MFFFIILAPGHRYLPSFSTHVYKLCLFIGQCRRGLLLLGAHLPTLPQDTTKVLLWMQQPKNIMLDRYLSQRGRRPNVGGIYAHTWSPGSPDVRHLPQPTDSAAGELVSAHSSLGCANGRLGQVAHVDSRNRPVDGIPAHSEILRR